MPQSTDGQRTVRLEPVGGELVEHFREPAA